MREIRLGAGLRKHLEVVHDQAGDHFLGRVAVVFKQRVEIAEGEVDLCQARTRAFFEADSMLRTDLLGARGEDPSFGFGRQQTQFHRLLLLSDVNSSRFLLDLETRLLRLSAAERWRTRRTRFKKLRASRAGRWTIGLQNLNTRFINTP